MNKYILEVKDFSKFFWRLGITDNNFPLQDFNEMFSTENEQYSIDLLGINNIIE